MALLRPFGPCCATRHADDEDSCPPAPASPSHPVQRTLYENASEAAATSDAEEGEQSEAGEEEEPSEGGDESAPLVPITANGDQQIGCLGKSTTGSSPREGTADVGRRET